MGKVDGLKGLPTRCDWCTAEARVYTDVDFWQLEIERVCPDCRRALTDLRQQRRARGTSLGDIEHMTRHIVNFAENIAVKAEMDAKHPATEGALAAHRARLDAVYEAAFGSPFEHFKKQE